MEFVEFIFVFICVCLLCMDSGSRFLTLGDVSWSCVRALREKFDGKKHR